MKPIIPMIKKPHPVALLSSQHGMAWKGNIFDVSRGSRRRRRQSSFVAHLALTHLAI